MPRKAKPAEAASEPNKKHAVTPPASEAEVVLRKRGIASAGKKRVSTWQDEGWKAFAPKAAA